MKIGASTYSVRAAIQTVALDAWLVSDWLAESGAEHIEIVPLVNLGFAATLDVASSRATVW